MDENLKKIIPFAKKFKGHIFLNVILFFFNLIPIAPLDGFKVLAGLLPYQTAQSFYKLEPIVPLLLLFLVFFGGRLFSAILYWPTCTVLGWLLSSVSTPNRCACSSAGGNGGRYRVFRKSLPR